VALSSGLGVAGGILPRPGRLLLLEASLALEVVRPNTRSARASALQDQRTGRGAARLAAGAFPMNTVVQTAICRFKHGKMDLEWDCPFCGDHNEWGLSDLPPIVVFSGAIPCFCQGCRKRYAIELRQRLTGVITREMKQ
jgi:hypothetical protein